MKLYTYLLDLAGLVLGVEQLFEYARLERVSAVLLVLQGVHLLAGYAHLVRLYVLILFLTLLCGHLLHPIVLSCVIRGVVQVLLITWKGILSSFS